MSTFGCARPLSRTRRSAINGLRFVALLLIPLLVTACTTAQVPSLKQQLERTTPLIQPLALAEIYRTTPAVPADRLARAPLADDVTGDAAINPAERRVQGERLYAVNCAPCHQANGEGNLNRFPALNNNALVTAQAPQPLIETVFYGRGVMPAFAPTLDDREIAAVLSYVRAAWDNEADAIMPSQVHEVMTAVARE